MTDTTNTGSVLQQSKPACKSGLCSVGLMKSFCPTCMLVGIVLFPLEMLVRLIRRAIGA